MTADAIARSEPTSSRVSPPGAARLVAKLAEVMAAVGRIPKTGYNKRHDYAFTTAADVVETVRAELAKRSVFLLPAVTSEERTPCGEKTTITSIGMEFTFLDGESGEALTRPWRGSGYDTQEKGLAKAITAGVKTFLMQTFLVMTTADRAPASRPVVAAADAEPRLSQWFPCRLLEIQESAESGKPGRVTVETQAGAAKTFGCWSRTLVTRAATLRARGAPVEAQIELKGEYRNLVGLRELGAAGATPGDPRAPEDQAREASATPRPFTTRAPEASPAPASHPVDTLTADDLGF